MIDKFRGQHGFLSNFYSAPIQLGTIMYPTSEHAYQAAKTQDLEMRKYIASRETPGQAKFEGKRVKLREDWEEIKLGVMEEILRAKFSNPTLAGLLLATGNEELVEGNTWNDTFWGVCKGKGSNYLGKLLMKIRSELSYMK